MSLTPAEALVLMDPGADNGIQAAKVTFLGLLAEGVLKLEQVAGRVFGRTACLRLARQPASNPPHIAAVLDAVRASRRGEVPDVARRLSKATRRFGTFVPALVRPHLVQRGLLEERRHHEIRRVLFFFRRTVTISTWHLTEAGTREQARLRQMLDEAPEIREALDSDPARAASMAAALGPLLVLVPALLPVLGLLGHAMAANLPPGLADSGGDNSWMTAMDDVSAEIDGSFDSALSDAASDSSDSSDSGDSGGSDGGGE